MIFKEQGCQQNSNEIFNGKCNIYGEIRKCNIFKVIQITNYLQYQTLTILLFLLIKKMSEYFRKYIKKQHFPLHYADVKFKTYFQNCIPQSMQSRQYKQTQQDDWNIYWCEKQFISETLDKIRLFPDKRINHFRNFYQICRKDLLSKNVKRFKKTLQKQGKQQEAASYSFMPLTYNLPSEYPIFFQEFKRNKDKQKTVWIMKPIGRSQGKGIFLFKNIGQISQWSQMSSSPEPYIVQRYINNPLLIGNKKFDLRIYVLVTSHNPLIIYLYRSGFARFTHYRYDANDISNYVSHLTNVAVQKCSDNYDQDRGGKYLLDKLRLYMISKFGCEATEECFYQIQELIIKTLTATAKVIVTDKRCFQLYGFDIMIDSNLKPWLIQVNGSPSMTANTPIDRNLKNGLLDDTLTVVNVQKLLTGEEQQVGGFDLIYLKTKRIKPGQKNISFLGCMNNRHQQMRKMAKNIALKLAEKYKQDKAKQMALQASLAANKDKRNRSTALNSTPASKTNSVGTGNLGANKTLQTSNNIINRNNQYQQRGTNQSVKLPKVPTNSNHLNTHSNNQIIPDLSIKRSTGQGTRQTQIIPTSKDSKRNNIK